MNITGCIITGLLTVLVAVMGLGAILYNAEKKRHEEEENRIRQEGANNAMHTANVITEAEKIKNDANTGNHSADLHTMAGQLHHYANGRK